MLVLLLKLRKGPVPKLHPPSGHTDLRAGWSWAPGRPRARGRGRGRLAEWRASFPSPRLWAVTTQQRVLTKPLNVPGAGPMTTLRGTNCTSPTCRGQRRKGLPNGQSWGRQSGCGIHLPGYNVRFSQGPTLYCSDVTHRIMGNTYSPIGLEIHDPF